MRKHSPLFHRIVLVLSALAALGMTAWAGLRLFEPVPVPLVPPAKQRVAFDPRADIRQNPLFGTLRAVLRGTIEPGVLGRPNPFAALNQDVSGETAGSSLGTVEEILLNGAAAIALSRANDGGVLVLLRGHGADGEEAYEVHRYAADEEPRVLGRWTVVVGSGSVAIHDAVTPVTLQQDGLGAIWFLSQGGTIGSLQSDGKPTWDAIPIFPNAGSIPMRERAMLAVDGAGRLWASDARTVLMGDGRSFQPVDLRAALSDEQRTALVALGSGVNNPPDAPIRLQSLADGRMSVVTPAFTTLFPMGLNGLAAVVGAFNPEGFVPLAVSPLGELWERNGTELVQRWATGTRAYQDPYVLPKQAPSQPMLFASDRMSLYALDYTSASTVVWKTAPGDGWLAQIALPSGPQPEDTAERIVVDGRGNVWALLKQQGLVLVRAPKTP